MRRKIRFSRNAMAELSAFGYRSRDTFLHHRDARGKIVAFICLTISVYGIGFRPLLLWVALTLMVGIRSGLTLVTIWRELKWFLCLLVVVFGARALSTPGETMLTIKCIRITYQGMYDGGLMCLRLFWTALAGLIFVLTTRISEIRAALVWFFRPVPFLPEKRIATMISLLIRFLPVILNQARLNADIQRARGIENRKNPIYRLSKFTVPLMRRIFLAADRLAIAMDARAYSESRTDPEFAFTVTDLLMVLSATGILLWVLIIDLPTGL